MCAPGDGVIAGDENVPDLVRQCESSPLRSAIVSEFDAGLAFDPGCTAVLNHLASGDFDDSERSCETFEVYGNLQRELIDRPNQVIGETPLDGTIRHARSRSSRLAR